MNKYERTVYPFTAIVGQDNMKKALILNVINPQIGGVLIRGEKGTAKSTAVRALAALLPEINTTVGCVYNCDPKDLTNLCDECKQKIKSGYKLEVESRKVSVVEMPVSTTEDRVVGTLDFQYAIKCGKCKFEPGLLAEANRGIVYVDEINLLDDHIVDVLLDTAAMGINIVEREGVSYSHPSEFVFVGTMNPEEGELRPQLLDRFGLCVEVKGERDPLQRVQIIKRREVFDNDSVGFLERWYSKECELEEKIKTARERVSKVTVSGEMLKLISNLCIEACVSGHRADIVMEITSRTIAAWRGRTEVVEEDVHEAAELALFHRVRESNSSQPDRSQSSENEDKNENQENEEDNSKKQPQNEQTEKSSNQKKDDIKETQNKDDKHEDKSEQEPQQANGDKQVVFSIGEPFQIKKIEKDKDRVLRKGSGRRSHTKTASKAGRYIRSTMQRDNNDLALDATLRAAAPYQLYRLHKEVAVAIESSDIRTKVREKKIGNFLLFVVDASGSMGAQQRMVETKGAILSLLLDAYQKRDKIGMIAFKGKDAELILPPTNSVELAHKLLEEMPTGGKTPLSSALNKAYDICQSELHKDENISPLLILISDGKGNVSLGSDKPLVETTQIAEIIREESRIKSLVIDVEKKSFVSFDLAKELADNMGSDYYKIDDLKSNTLIQAVKEQMN